VAAELGADEADVALALDAGRMSQAYELNAEAAGETDPLDAVEDRVFLSNAFRGLDEADRRILYLRFVRDLEAAEVAGKLGMSQRQLSRRTESALATLRQQLEDESAPAEEEHESAPAKRRRPRRDRKPLAGTPVENSYRIEIVRQPGATGGWAATVAELPGCVAWGATQVEAVTAIDEAISAWIAEATANGREIPKPRAAASHSGRLLVRMPQSLHADLSRAAEREEVSLNQFITSVLASAVGWRVREDAERHDQPADDSARRRALGLNLVVLAVVGLTALALLAVELAQRI
jgi:predicted RNase H-like HicB family nuclease